MNFRLNFFLLLLGMGLLSLTAGCSSISVNYDYDNTVNFQQFQSYGWIETQPGAGSGQASGLWNRRIKSAVDAEMATRGMALDNQNPDLWVAFHLGAKDKIQVTDWGYRYPTYYRGWGTRDIDVYSYTEGQLIIDMVDNEIDELVWRGTGTKVIDQRDRTPEELQADVNEAVNKIMASFPPPGK